MGGGSTKKLMVLDETYLSIGQVMIWTAILGPSQILSVVYLPKSYCLERLDHPYVSEP